MPTETSASTPPGLNSLPGKSSFLSDYENKMRDTSHIIAAECLSSLQKGRSNAMQSQLRFEMALNKTTDRLERLKIKQHLIFDKHVIDFAEALTRRIEKKPDYCHTFYNKYQVFLDSHTRLQCIGFYTFLENPRLVNEFSMSHIPRYKRWAREMHAEGLNILSLGNNKKIFEKN